MTKDEWLGLQFIIALAVLYLLIQRLRGKWAQREKIARYHRGYAHACVELVSGKSTPNQLLERSNSAFDRNEFDEGIKDAVRAFREAKRIHDDSPSN
jgi:hypothetical protein